MPHREAKRRLRIAGAALLATMLLSLLAAGYAGSAQSWLRAGERYARLRGLPPEGGKNESDEIQTRAQAAFNRLAYPARTIPPAWQSRAQAYLRQHVRDGADMFPAAGAPNGTRPVGTTSWTGLGPAPIDNDAAADGYKYGLVTGRINALAVDPTNSAVAYAGATAGGLWKTTNCCSASTSWSPLWEGKDFVTQSASAIAIDPNNHSVLYVGTGDFDAGDQFSAGVMKSTDAGATWTQLGADVFTPFAAGTPDKPDQNIGALAVDPRNSNTVLVGTRHGFFVSYNAGATWARYNVHSHASESQQVSSIVLDGSTNPTTMYVAIGSPYASRAFGDIGGGNGVYKASVPSSGAPSFTLLNNGWPAGTGSGASNNVGRIRLAKSAQNPQIIYAQVGDYNNFNALGTWVTTNGGGSWAQLSGSDDFAYQDCTSFATSEGQDWYDLFLGVDPSNDKILYVGRTDLYKIVVNNSYTGVSSITDLSNVYSTSCAGYGTLHPDQHAVAMISSSQFLVGNDGGIYLGSGAVGGFTAMQNGLNISQFYAGQLGANFASSSSQFAFGGMQDNGSASWDAANTSQQWQARGNGGDGFFAAFDPIGGTKSQGNWYTEYTYGQLSCSITGAQGPFTSSCIGGWYTLFGVQLERSDWSTPFTLDQLHCTNASCRNIILGTYRMWASGTGGTSRAGWTAVSPDLTKGNNQNDSASNTIIDVRFAPSSPTSAVVGTDDGNVQWSNTLYTGANCTQAASGTAAFACTPNASASWVNLTGGNAVLPNRAIQGVGFDPSNAQVVYAAVGGFNTNTPGTPGHLFQASCSASCTSAASWSWVDKSSNLPDVPADSVIANPNNRKQVFVGTHFGFYYTNDIDASPVVWQRYQNGLPNTVLKYLTIDRGATTLAAFTYGRSVYSIQLPGAGGFGNAPAAPSGLGASAASSSQVSLSWSDNASDETGFKIERCSGVGCSSFAQVGTAGANATSYSDTGLVASTSYTYRVRATNGGGDSAYSNTASATTLAANMRNTYLPLTQK
ncbi:fibronectin type III domain-containing protein [Kouleothrix sp.]|uniref:fibronectin type III domain-containing protein n=1 Tax=Kouleothrix sp. TaxID=2779161 RepID=UPI00391D26DA